jgi:hypothetical protein
MIRYLAAGLACLAFAACSTHYYEVKENTVVFYLKNNQAEQVEFRYSEDHFIRHTARKVASDTWEIRVPVHEEFSYFYMVDGKFFTPSCRMKEMDDFGNENCLFSMEL